jgi:hypothetical protein
LCERLRRRASGFGAAQQLHVHNGHRLAGASATSRNLHTRERAMCRNIRTLFNFEPPASEMEIRDASLQFVRKLSGFNVPSKANEAAFEKAVEQVAAAARGLIASLVTTAPAKNREEEAEKARMRSLTRFG